ncbi:MAG: tetratricopeptide repeat protein [Verrucomicrobiales bacterium]|nr:tetratricopeptide repeat protein [Verrucomicrobiales bacterium]
MLLASWVMMGSLGAGNAEAASPVAAPGKLHMGRRVQTARSGDASDSAAQLPCNLELGFRVTTGPRGWAFGEFRDRTTFEMIPLTRMMVESDAKQTNRFVVRLDQGELYVISRGGGSSIPFRTAYAEGVAKGTEYVLSVDPIANELRVVMLDGEVELRRDGEVQTVRSGQMGVVGQGRTIEVTSLRAANVIQWWIDFPVVLDSDDLPLDDTARARLAASITAYRQGNLELALELLPEAGEARSAAVAVGEAERVYRAAVLLAAGEVAEARRWLGNAEASTRIGTPLRVLLRALTHPLIAGTDTGETAVSPVGERSASEWLALSFFEQSRHRLDDALEAARRASLKAPRFGAVWARLAELEFGAGRHGKARTALSRAMELSPASAAVSALDGFVKASLGEMRAARKSFERAIELDPRHANGWLGRGLCRIRAGDAEGGGEDLRIAAALDPDRSLLRSYAGKAFAQAGESKRARQEWDYARVLDDADPTPWLYSALERASGNEVNEALRELGESMRRNDNRAVYRSRELLDEDRAIRGANLALMYQDAGLEDFAEREATRAVEADYMQAAAHLFLANSYDALRDPRQVNLRYESPWYSEYLLANLLSPVGASPLSPTISQHEYTRLFEKEGPGLVNRTLWTSNGDWLERAAQFGRWGNFAYALDADVRSNRGWRGNEDQEQLTLTATVKQQVGPEDSVWAQVTYYDAESGDVRQLMDPGESQARYRFDERLEPMALAGWHHRWSPDSSTLVLLSGWSSGIAYTNPTAPSYVILGDTHGAENMLPSKRAMDIESRFVGGGLEIQQILKKGSHTLVGGARVQIGTFDVDTEVKTTDLDRRAPGFGGMQRYEVTPGFDRLNVYGYDTWQPWERLRVTGGLTYDRLGMPANFRAPPTSEDEETMTRLLPKVGVSWEPWLGGTLRGSYTRTLSGVSFDQSVRLEPVQVAGYNQAYRGLIPEAKLGSLGGQEMETFGLAFDHRFPSDTFVVVTAEDLTSQADPMAGVYRHDQITQQVTEEQLRRNVEYRERSLSVTLGQLAGDWFAINVSYRLSESSLEENWEAASFANYGLRERAVLHQVDLGARFHHPSGWFARWNSGWRVQYRSGKGYDLPGDEFWQHDVWLGWRGYQRRVEVAVGLLNLTDRNYGLDPLSYYLELPRERMLVVDFRLQF